MTELDKKAVWPGWETVRLIGRGSFGAVYEIERDVFGHKEKAALKLITIPQSESDIEELYDSGYDDASITATFKSHMESIVNEYTLMREMNGAANVVNCDDFRIVPHDEGVGWDIYIKMELLTPLTKALDVCPPESQVIRIAADLCKALVLCRKYGIIHRDIKPQNIFVSRNGDYKLGDFGIAKTIEKTSGGTKIGTYKYMAPEVYNNQPYNLTADIYSLGLVLYWILNERRSPFIPLPPAPVTAAQEENARARRFGGEPLPEPVSGSSELKRIVLKACAFDPADRYQSADEMLKDIEALGGAHKTETMTAGRRIETEPDDDATVSMHGGAERAEPHERLLTKPGTDDEDATVSMLGKDEEQSENTVTGTDTKEQDDDRTVGVLRKKIYSDRNTAEPETGPTPSPDAIVPDESSGRENTPNTSESKNKNPRFKILIAAILLIAAAAVCFFTIHIWQPATCTEPEKCRICGKTRGAALDHEWSEWMICKAATCTEEGEKRRVCLRDKDHEETSVIPPFGHDWGDATENRPAQCANCCEFKGTIFKEEWPCGFIKIVPLSEKTFFICFRDDRPEYEVEDLGTRWYIELEFGEADGALVKEDESLLYVYPYAVSIRSIAYTSVIKQHGKEWYGVGWNPNNFRNLVFDYHTINGQRTGITHFSSVMFNSIIRDGPIYEMTITIPDGFEPTIAELSHLDIMLWDSLYEQYTEHKYTFDKHDVVFGR